MTLHQRLLIAFVGIAIAVLAAFGVVAHYVAMNFAAESEIHTLRDFVHDKATSLNPLLAGKTVDETTRLLSLQNRDSGLPVMLLDAHNKVFAATPPAHALDLSRLGAYFEKLPAGKEGGIVSLATGEALWSLAAVPGTAYRLVLFHVGERELSFLGAPGMKLFIAAVIIICVTAWAAMILAKVFSHRLDQQNPMPMRQSLHDHLADLPNRTQLFDRLQQALSHARRQDQPLALFLIELGNLKEINDTLGRQSGDTLLKQIGPRLQDAVMGRDTVVRLEGSEFALVLPGLDKQHVAGVARKIIQALEPPFMVDGLALEIRAMVGVALFPEHGDEPDTLFRQAGVAMCLSRCQGNDLTLYTPHADPHSVKQLTLMSELRQAIGNNELQLYYQPKLDLESHKVIGVEALLRWFHPQRGMIPPDEFIPKAEQTGLIKPLTKWVIEQAFRQSRIWNKQGIPLQIAINISQRSLYDRELINQIADTMQQMRISSCILDFEITETAIMARPEQSMASLRMLHAMGVRLSIDDFGTGFTSLAYLKELPVDELKIDKSFVIGMLKDAKDVMIVRSIIELAHSLGRVVVAEGVTSKESLRLLQTMKCDTAQGFYISKPLPAAEFERWLKASRWNPAVDQARRA